MNISSIADSEWRLPVPSGEDVGERLDESVLAVARSLPVKPASVTLRGSCVELVPLDLARDVEPLFAVSNGSAIKLGERAVDEYDPERLIWRYMAGGPFQSSYEFGKYLQPQVESENGLCFCVLEVQSGRQVGVCTYMNNFPAHLKLELGNIWYSPIVQRTNANLEATYLMATHAFALGYRRLEWKCDALNARSRASALKMGFTFEGIQESHFIIKGRNRDTAWFRILDKEWGGAKSQMEGRLRMHANGR